jgi:hypothetical protein
MQPGQVPVAYTHLQRARQRDHYVHYNDQANDDEDQRADGYAQEVHHACVEEDTEDSATAATTQGFNCETAAE